MALSNLTGSVPDVVSMALGLSDAMSPDKGFAYNLCTFTIDLREPEDKKKAETASAGTAQRSKEKGASLASSAPSSAAAASTSVDSRAGPVILVVKLGAPGDGGPRTVVEIGIRELATPDRIAGVVELRALKDFDTSILNSLAIEVVAQEGQIVPGGILLFVKGLINPVGFGFAHFVGSVLVKASPGVRPTLQSEAKFITQAPPRGIGSGIFGWVIDTSARGSSLSVWAYRAAMFSR